MSDKWTRPDVCGVQINKIDFDGPIREVLDVCRCDDPLRHGIEVPDWDDREGTE